MTRPGLPRRQLLRRVLRGAALALTTTALPRFARAQAATTGSTPMTPAQPAAPVADDPYLWLEDVHGEQAMAWVRQRNADSEARLQAVPGHERRRQAILEVLDSSARIPAVQRLGPWFYNLWKDAKHPRGLWRRTTLDSYRSATPDWETVLDLDALGAAEGENWVWSGQTALGPDYRRCLVALSRGGADATVVREFDTVTKRFVDGGFTTPEAKTDVTWVDIDTVYIGSDFGPGSLTDSGYPRVIKRWKRGQPLAEAQTVFEGERSDVAVYAFVDATPGFERQGFGRYTGFYDSRSVLLQGDAQVALPKPDDAALAFWRDRVLLTLRSAWTVAGRTWPAGSLLVGDATAFLKGQPQFDALFTPTASRSLSSYAVTATTVLVDVLDNVASRIEEWRPKADGPGWQRREVAAPYPGSLSVTALHDPLQRDDPLAEHYLLGVADFLHPDALQLAQTGRDTRETLKALPAFFDATGMRAEQRFATSADGTRVPYFVIWPAGATADGRNPTLLYGYGGFEVSLTPWYLAANGRAWVGEGGVFAVANIRGGGEFGPAWHQAALKHQRQKSYDDFAAVAEDLVRTRVTNPQQLGIQGGSNGGLLVGAVMMQRPELFGAVVCQVPLLDMKRYHLLLAGASWMSEYGNPDDPADWAAISRYSPYQAALRHGPGSRLPAVLFTTSTRDDRVHPGHARKLAARLAELGHAPLYWENIEGGHGGAADNRQRAQMRSLELSFLWQALGRR